MVYADDRGKGSWRLRAAAGNWEFKGGKKPEIGNCSRDPKVQRAKDWLREGAGHRYRAQGRGSRNQ